MPCPASFSLTSGIASALRMDSFSRSTIGFGVPTGATKQTLRDLTRDLSKQEAQCSQDVSHIMDDMQAYFERRRMQKFKSVLDDMAKQDVVGGLRQLGDDLPKENGLSMAQCEYWSDTLDRWAEDLVDPASGGT